MTMLQTELENRSSPININTHPGSTFDNLMTLTLDLRVNAYWVTATYCMSTMLRVDSSSCFTFRAQTHMDTQSQMPLITLPMHWPPLMLVIMDENFQHIPISYTHEHVCLKLEHYFSLDLLNIITNLQTENMKIPLLRSCHCRWKSPRSK